MNSHRRTRVTRASIHDDMIHPQTSEQLGNELALEGPQLQQSSGVGDIGVGEVDEPIPEVMVKAEQDQTLTHTSAHAEGFRDEGSEARGQRRRTIGSERVERRLHRLAPVDCEGGSGTLELGVVRV